MFSLMILPEAYIISDGEMTNQFAAPPISADSVRNAELRFQFGEIVFYTWTPKMAVVHYSTSSPDLPTEIRGNLKRLLPPEASGVIVRGLLPASYAQGVRIDRDAVQYVPHYKKGYLVDIDGEFEAYVSEHLSTKARQNIRRAVRKLKTLNK